MADKNKVYEIYNIVASWFDHSRSQDLRLERSYLDQFTALLKPDSKILDLGCGTGRPIAAHLLQHGFAVTAVDGSEKMIELAKEYIPDAHPFVHDMRTLKLNERFDGIIMWHSSFHLPVEDQQKLFQVIDDHLKEGGVLMFTSGTEHSEIWGEMDGQPLYHASLSTEEYKSLLAAHRMEVLTHNMNDATAGGATVWVARKLF